MLTDYVRDPEILKRMRASCVGPYLDDLAKTMAGAGFKALTIEEHLRSVAHLAHWGERRGIALARWDEGTLGHFRRHLVRRRLGKRERVIGHGERFLAFLRTRGVIPPSAPTPGTTSAPIVDAFVSWIQRHRGAVPHTLDRYRRSLDVFVGALGQNPAGYAVASIRAFVVKHLGHRGPSETFGARQNGPGSARENGPRGRSGFA